MVNLHLVPLKSSNLGTLELEISLPIPYDNDKAADECKMTAKAVLLCRPNSHPFQERTLVLDQPVKVGRSVARARPAPNNGIFDCKVLSRNHASLWYENGKFYLQDTKSSNGTFVNNQRLSKGSEESTPREVCSGDIVQFGVDVMENSRKVTHGCIVATLKLYLPDGKEAKASPSTVMLPSCPSTIATQDLYQLAQCLQEALHREQMLECKLANLQKLINLTDEVSESSWKALIDEDRLLTRLEVLGNQVQTCSKNVGEDALRQEVVRLQEDKDNYQVTAKESLKKVLQEKLEAVRKLQDVERLLNNAENECKNLQQVYVVTQKELQDLAEKYNSRLKEIQDLTERIQVFESKDKILSEKSEQELEKEALDNENDYSKDEISVDLIKVSLDDTKNSSTDGEDSPNESILPTLKSTQGVQVDLIVDGNLNQEVKGNFWQTREEIENLSSQLKNSEKELLESKSKVSDLKKLLDKAQVEAVKSMNKVAQLEVQLNEAKTQSENSCLLIKRLQEQILKLEDELKGTQQSKAGNDAKLKIICSTEVDESPTPTVTFSLPSKSLSPCPSRKSVTTNGVLGNEEHKEATQLNNVTTEIEKLKELLDETRENKLRAEREVVRFKAELEDARNNVKKAADDANALRQQLLAEQLLVQEKSDIVSLLQDQLKRADLSTQDVQQQISSLKERLSLDQQKVQQKQDEVDVLRQQLSEAQHSYKQAHNEAEQLKNKVESLSRQLESQTTVAASHSSLDAGHLEVLSKDSTSLMSTIQNLEANLRQAKNEKAKLLEDYKRLSETQRESRSPAGGSQESQDIETLREEIDTSKKKLLDAYSEIVSLKEACNAYNEERIRLRHELEAPTDHDVQIPVYAFLSLLMVVIGILVVFYPKLALITATLDPTLPS